jgi:hypothetical protein
MGYRLEKSRARDPDALTYGGYHIVDVEIGGLVAGWGNAGRGFSFTLNDVEAWLVEPEQAPPASALKAARQHLARSSSDKAAHARKKPRLAVVR